MRFLPVACIIASACMYALTRPLVAHAYTLLSLSFSLYLYLPSTSNNNSKRERERERERGEKKGIASARISLLKSRKKRWVFAKRSKCFTSIVVKLTPRAGACCVLPTLSTTFSHDIARIRGFHLRSLSLSLSLSPAVYSTKRISTVNRPNKGVA